MVFSFDETDDFDEIDDFDDESQDSYLDEEDADVVDLEDDLEDSATALSHAFREAAAVEEVEEDEDEEAVEEPEDEKEDTPKERGSDDTESYEQRLAEAIDALPDEEDLEAIEALPDEADLEAVPPLELPPVEVEFLRPQEQNNFAYADALKAYYEEKDYQRAIEKFAEAIENEAQGTPENVTNSNSIVAKAMYWQAEAYVKMQDIPQAIVTFENLIQTCQEHYLSLAAERRATQLNPK